LQNGAWAGVAALGFAILFNVPPRVLWACALSGALAFLVRAGVAGLEPSSLELATFCAALLVSVSALGLGKLLRAPALLFSVPAIIPLVPGALAFRTVRDVLRLTMQSRHADTLLLGHVVTNSVKTMLVIIAIALGVALPNLLLRKQEPMT
jgi:uncharacterized membrane protein YjjB (DUF3815 family)